MLSHTHAIGGAALTYTLHKLGYIHPSMADYIVTSAAALLPDLDHSSSVLGRRFKLFTFLKHRGLTHSLLGIALLYFILNGIQTYVYQPIEPYINYILLGCISHVLLDMLTPSGVSLFYPFKKRIKIPLIKTGSWLETAFALCMVALMGYTYIR